MRPILRYAAAASVVWSVAGVVVIAVWAVLCAVFMLASPACKAAEPLSNSDLYRQVAVSAALIADASQTLYAYEHRWQGFGEKNSIVRAHYSPAGIRNYFGAALIGTAVVTRALPPDYRPYWQYSVLAVELAAIVRNKRIGVRFEF